MENFKLIFIGIVYLSRCCFSSKMLMIMAAGPKSHKHFYSSIAEVLAERGHQITFISPYKASVNISNIEEIQLSTNYFELIMANAFEVSLREMSHNFLEVMPKGCVDSMLEPLVQKALKRNYDLVFLPFSMSDCYFSVIYEKQIPFVYFFPNSLFAQYFKVVANHHFPSTFPNLLMEATWPMSFTQRLKNTLFTEFLVHYTDLVTNKRMEEEGRTRGIFPSDMPSLSELQTESSLTILNSVRTLETPVRPYTPTIISAGGLHLKPSKPLPPDLEDWIQGSGEDGFIFFSLGSQVKPSNMKEKHRQIIVNVFKDLKQRIIWKWDQSEMEGLSSNVMIGPWFPQQDILGHHKIRLFITHGGLLSTQESTYFGVTTIGMPVYVDQFHNVNHMTSEGWGLRLDWQDLTEEKFREVILDGLTNKSIREKVALRSELMKDRPLSASEEVVYWVEYVLRHDGAKHLESPFKNLYWFQIYNIDVWLSVFTTLIIISLIIIYFVKSCIRKVKNLFKQKTD